MNDVYDETGKPFVIIIDEWNVVFREFSIIAPMQLAEYTGFTEDEFHNSTESADWIETFKSFRKSQELLKATWERREEKVAELLEWFHDTAENRTYHSEAALSYAVQMAYYAAQKYYTTIQELDSGKGYCDLVYLPSPRNPEKPALLIELKYGKTAGTAADQIRARNYPQKLEHYEENILLVGINYDKEVSNEGEKYKHHSCMIEEA